MNQKNGRGELHFEEFIEICSDSGLVTEENAREIINFAKAIGGVGAVPRITGEEASEAGDFAVSLVSNYPEDMTFNNYVTTEENYYAAEIARTIALIPRVWKSITPVMLHALTGQGKTHLMAAIAKSTHKNTLIVNTVDLHIEYQQCFKAGLEKELRDWITSFDLLLLDDVQFSQGDLAFQKFIISIINRMPRGKHGIITSSDVHPGRLLDIDASFYSRLTSGLVIKLETLNLEGRLEILRNLFSTTGIKPDDEIIQFIADNVKLNIRQLKAAGRMVLAHMLGPGHDVSLDDVKEMLAFMQLQRRDAVRPRASELNVEPGSERGSFTVSHSPYIVVDIDEEKPGPAREEAAGAPEAARSEPDIEPQPMIQPEQDSRPPAPVEETPQVEIPEEQIYAEPEPAENGKSMPDPLAETPSRPSVPEDSTTDREKQDSQKYRSMVESASTVERQVEALKQAVSERIEKLQEKNADSREIDKLRFALAFLDQGKLEAAMLALRPD